MAQVAGQKQRTTRPVRTSTRYSDMAKEMNGYDSYKDDQYSNGPAVPASRVDLTKMKIATLKKYTKVYDVPNVDAQSSKEDLASAVSKHWNSMVINEEHVLQNLMRVRGRH